jgi:catechol 2,3-dioxygenase-like lactoylglutathione lyase family enzyme
MSRLQLALNVSNIDEAVDFYTKLFNTPPAKRRPGYANFAIADPPLKLVLMEAAEQRGPGVVNALNHLGVEVETSEEVVAATARFQGEGMATTIEEQTDCCYAIQNKVWVEDPDHAPWEVYVVLADSPTGDVIADDELCCLPVETQTITLGSTHATPAH